MSFVKRLAHSVIAATVASAPLFAALASTAHAAPPTPADKAAAAPADARRITFNGKPATAKDLEILARFERLWGAVVPSGDYWYDNTSGAAGVWGGPVRGVLGAGLGLGGAGPVPANASGGGTGRVTGVFINGRELHPLDVQGLTMLLGQAPWPGQWWVDGQGWFGQPGQGAIGNLYQLIAMRNQAKGGGGSYYKSDISQGKSTFVGSGCAAVHARTNPSRSDSDTYSYYVGCE